MSTQRKPIRYYIKQDMQLKRRNKHTLTYSNGRDTITLERIDLEGVPSKIRVIVAVNELDKQRKVLA